MFNEYLEAHNAEAHRQRLLNEAEHNRRLHAAFGGHDPQPVSSWRRLVWPRSFWSKLFQARGEAAS